MTHAESMLAKHRVSACVWSFMLRISSLGSSSFVIVCKAWIPKVALSN
jgi:hypothetical protein